MAEYNDDKIEGVDVVELSEEELDVIIEQEKQARLEREEMLEGLALSVESKFTTRCARRAVKENQWLRAAKLYYGKLAIEGSSFLKGETPWQHPVGVDRPDVNVVRSKCSIAIAQTVSMQFGTTNKNWDLFPDKTITDIKNIEACSKMSDAIEQQLDDCKYPMQSRKAMWDRVVLGTGVMKGPLSVGKLVRSYVQLEDSTTWIPDLKVDYTPQIVRVNPWFFYPDDSVEESTKVGDSIQIHPMSALDLKKLMKHEGFKAECIEEVLQQKPNEYTSETWSDFAKLSESNPHIFKNKYTVLEYYGPITKTQLDMLSIEPCYDSVNDEYYGEVWVVQGKVIRIELESIEASYCIPYTISVWEKDPSSVFGYGVPLMMEDAQRVVNESWHMILDNSSLSSGPQVALQKSLIEPANGKWELSPDKIWYLTDMGADVEKAIQFFNVPNVTGQIVPIMQMAQAFSEEESGIPLITAGLNSPEMGNTATGDLIVRHASTTLLDFMSEEWDDNMTAPHIESMYAWNMQYSPRPDIKGAFTVDVKTSTQYKNKQLHIRDMEKLSVESAQNPEMAKWINQGELQRARLEMMSLPSKMIIKSVDQVKEEEETAKANAQPPIELMQLQLDARKVALEEAQLAFNSQQQQQREVWDHEEKLMATQARFIESQARVAVSQNEKETEILKLAQRNEETALKLLSQERIARENNQTKAFVSAMDETRKQQELGLYERELELKASTGSGI